MNRSTQKIWQNTSGAVTLEFIFLIPIFFLIVFSIFEVSLSFLAAHTIRQESEKIARHIQIGKFQNTTPEDILTQNFCKKRVLKTNCKERIKIKLLAFDTYAEALTYLENPANNIDSKIQTNDIDAKAFLSKKIAFLVIHYQWPILLKFLPGYISSFKDQIIHHFIRKVWQNEDF